MLKIIFIRKRTLLISIPALAAFSLVLILIYNQFIKLPVNIFVDPCNGVIVIDPGHGGIDGGASRGGVIEKTINLDISLKLKARLEQKGYKVILTREEDISLDGLTSTGDSRHQRDLNARADMINASSAQLFLSIHGNCHSRNYNTNGSIVFYGNKYAQNKTLAYCLQRALNNITVNGRKRTVHDPQTADFFLLKHSDIPGAIIETAFISNDEEQQLLKTDEFKNEIAKAIADGVSKYLDDAATKKKVSAFHPASASAASINGY